MFKPWLTKVVIILAALLLSACNIQSGQQSVNKQPKPLQGQILVGAEIPLGLTEAQSITHQKIIKEIINEFTKLNPQVKIFVEFSSQTQSLKMLQLEMNRGAAPDLLLLESSFLILELVQAGQLQVVDNTDIDRSQFRPEALADAVYQGQIYGLPLYLDTQALCYNKDKVRELPKTLPELVEQARRGYSVGLHSGIDSTFWGAGIFGGRAFDPKGKVILDQGGWAEWMKWLKEAQNEPNFILSENIEALQAAFVQGKLAYLTCWSDSIPYFLEALGKDKLGVTLLPGEANQPATPTMRTAVLVFNRASSPNQTQLALKLAQFLTNLEQQKQLVAAFPYIPSNKNLIINESLFPLRVALIEQSRTALATSLDETEIVRFLVDYGESLYQQILKGEISPDEAARKLSESANRQFGLE